MIVLLARVFIWIRHYWYGLIIAGLKLYTEPRMSGAGLDIELEVNVVGRLVAIEIFHTKTKPRAWKLKIYMMKLVCQDPEFLMRP